MAELTIHHRRLLDDMANLADSQKHSDFVISCGGRRFNVHKAIMCSASPALAAAFNVNMTESQTGIVEHTEYDADTVEHMISYVYKTDYKLPEDIQLTVSTPVREEPDDSTIIAISGSNAGLIAHVRIYAIASYYQLPTLKILALQNFAFHTKDRFETGDFIHVLREVSRHISKDDVHFHAAVRTVAVEHLTELTLDSSFMADLAELEDVQDFAAEMLRHVVRTHRRACALQEMENVRRDVQISELETECAKLKGELKDERAEWEATSVRSSKAWEGDLRHLEDVMQRLVDDVKALPSKCRNANCERVFGELRLERKGFQGRSGEGNWEVRCGRCRCRLCK